MKISGHLDLCGPSLIEGWLYCDAWGEEKIKLQVYVGNDLIGECTADRFRADLRDAGFGDGKCGFSYTVPEAHAGLDFTQTRLRLLETPVYLLPNEATRIADAAEGGHADAPTERNAALHFAGAGDESTLPDDAQIVRPARPEATPRRGGSFFRALNA